MNEIHVEINSNFYSNIVPKRVLRRTMADISVNWYTNRDNVVTHGKILSTSGNLWTRNRHEEARRESKSPQQLHKYFEVHDTSDEQMEATKLIILG